MMENLNALLDKSINTSLISCVLSNKKNKLGKIDKIKIRQVIIKDEYMFQITEYCGTKVIHQNKACDETKAYIAAMITSDFKQCQLLCESFSATALISSKGQLTIREKASHFTLDTQKLNHNRTKEYLLPEGTAVPFLVDLGVMNESGYVIKSKYDKFRQINRFLEFVQDIIPALDKHRKINILDFGCGKSYLTFAMYYYLREINGFDLTITGLDLKEDVICKCNRLAEKYGYCDLHFLKGDVAEYNSMDEVDMVVTLHACDTATDYALAKAVMWEADVILSVPCCQHELNKTISNDLMSPVFKYGIIKERTAALLTDGIRGCILERAGYDTQILEFIDMEHTPKNILIRAVKRSKGRTSNSSGNFDFDNCKSLMDQFNVSPTLYRLLSERGVID